MQHAPINETDSTALYTAALQRMALRIGAPPADRDTIVEQELVLINGSVVALRLEEWSAFIRVWVEVGMPGPQHEAEVFRQLLTQMSQLATPVSVWPGLHPQTQSLLVCGCTPLPTSDEEDEAFLAFLHACVAVCEAWRETL